MLVTLHDGQPIRFQVLGAHVPRFAVAFLSPADPESLTLAEGVVHQTLMPADDVSVRGDYVPWLHRQITIQEFAERPFAYETDSGGVFLVVVRQLEPGGEFTHVALVHRTQRRQGTAQLCLDQPVEKVTLI